MSQTMESSTTRRRRQTRRHYIVRWTLDDWPTDDGNWEDVEGGSFTDSIAAHNFLVYAESTTSDRRTWRIFTEVK